MLIVVAILVAALGVHLMFAETTMKYGLILLGIVIVSFLVWKAFVKNGKEDLRRSEARNDELEQEVTRLKDSVSRLARELEEKNRSRLNVTGLTPILHVSVLNIDTSFVRTFVREEGPFTFNGALRADICAEYGVRLEDVRFRYDESVGKLYLADFHPGLISYSKKQLNWDLARAFRTRKFLGRKFSAVEDTAADVFAKRMCEQLRADVEKEIDQRRIEEFEWLAPVISRQVKDVLKLALGRQDVDIVAVEGDVQDPAFVNLESFLSQRTKEISAGQDAAGSSVQNS